MHKVEKVQPTSKAQWDFKNPIELIGKESFKQESDIVKIEYDNKKYMIHKIADGTIELKKMK